VHVHNGLLLRFGEYKFLKVQAVTAGLLSYCTSVLDETVYFLMFCSNQEMNVNCIKLKLKGVGYRKNDV
jgi:hypothetical protein